MSVRRPSFGGSVGLTCWFVILWLLLWADLNVANVVSGTALGAVVVFLTRRAAPPVGDSGVRISPFALLHFGGHVLWQLVKSNIALAWEIVTPTDTIATGTVDVPLRSDSPTVAMAVSNVVTLTPGTVTLDVGFDPPMLTIAALHLHDPDGVRRQVRRTEYLAIRAFGSATARAAVAAVDREVPS